MTSERIRVLILDDEALLGLAAKDYLEDEGRFEAFVAEDAESGLDLLRRQAVDVCLVDLRLPGSSGIEFMLQTAPRHQGVSSKRATKRPSRSW